MMAEKPSAFDPSLRGFHAVYRENEVNHCPGCGRVQWIVGRSLAECAFCATALPLEASLRPQPSIIRRGDIAPDPWPSPSLERPRLIRRSRT